MAPTMKVREVIRLIEQDGWYLVASKGSHMHHKHDTKPGRVTVAGKGSKDMEPGTLILIPKQTGLRK